MTKVRTHLRLKNAQRQTADTRTGPAELLEGLANCLAGKGSEAIVFGPERTMKAGHGGNAKGSLDHPDDPAFTRRIDELLAALDEAVSAPKRDVDKPFLMPIEGVHTVEGRARRPRAASSWAR